MLTLSDVFPALLPFFFLYSYNVVELQFCKTKAATLVTATGGSQFLFCQSSCLENLRASVKVLVVFFDGDCFTFHRTLRVCGAQHEDFHALNHAATLFAISFQEVLRDMFAIVAILSPRPALSKNVCFHMCISKALITVSNIRVVFSQLVLLLSFILFSRDLITLIVWITENFKVSEVALIPFLIF